MPHLDQPVHYEIRVDGHIDHSIIDRFGPMQLIDTVDVLGECTTALTGIVTDQAGIMGLIRHLHNLGIVLLSIERHSPKE